MKNEPDTFTSMEEIPWLLLLSNQYYLPALFAHARYGPWMDALFPTRLVYAALANDILLPSDGTWDIVRRTFDNLPENFKDARRVALQLRSFYGPQPLTVTQCMEQFPEILDIKAITQATEQNPATPVVVFVVSLHRIFYDHLKQALRDAPSVLLVQPSTDESQKSMSNAQNIQALAEMWIIAASDVVVMTAESTFGYHAAALAHRVPYVIEMRGPRSSTDTNSLACWKGDTYEPCYQHPNLSEDLVARMPGRGLRRCQDRFDGISTVWR